MSYHIKKHNKKEAQRFVTEVHKILAEYCAPNIEHLFSTFPFYTMTRYGRLLVSPDEVDDVGQVPSITMRFLDVPCSSEVDCSRSGKWNIHEFDIDDAIYQLRVRLDDVGARLPTKEEQAQLLAEDTAALIAREARRIESNKAYEAYQHETT